MRQSYHFGMFLIAAMEQTNKIWKTYINTKALSMDVTTSVVEKNCEKW